MSDTPKPESDKDLFRSAVGEVAPIRGSERSDSRGPLPKPRPLQREKDEAAVLEELLDPVTDLAELETGEELLFLRPGIQKRYLTRLRRGHYSIRDTIDLHQMNEAVAADTIRQFIDQAVARGLGCVRIIHGKGLRSRNGPKLKLLTRRLLSRHPRVLAFASCRPVDGGTGAVNVLLKAR
ncbi:MAG: SMR domain protein [Xanthomonadales bacterium]|nr:SMR domain protein [Xanthomonadales bacterium]